MLSKLIGITTLVALAIAPALFADRTTVSPDWSMLTHQQDVEIGQRLANDLENQYTVFGDNDSNVYLDALGNQLATHAPGEKFNYRFKVVDDRTFNTFALPGGFIYVNRGVIEASQSQPQLAGVLAHQIAHVALRHGSSQISNAYLNLGNRRGTRNIPVGAVLSQVDIGFGPNSTPLKFTREQERQADLAAAQILHDAGFDPRPMAELFQQEQSSGRASDFFASHPSPVNRAANVRAELQRLGGLPANMRTDSADFNAVKNVMLSAAEPYNYNDYRRGDRSTRNEPYGRKLTYNGNDIRFDYPQNWRITEDGNVITVAPSGGLVSGQLAYGMQIGTYDWRDGRYFGQGFAPLGDRPYGGDSLRAATDQFLDYLRQSNPDLRSIRSQGQMRVGGEQALVSQATNQSPQGGLETDWIVTVLRPGGTLYYFIGAAPQREFSRYSPTFEDVVSSVRFY